MTQRPAAKQKQSEKRAAALRRNLVRRKEATKRAAHLASVIVQPMSEPCLAEGEPRSGRGQHSVGTALSVPVETKGRDGIQKLVPFHHQSPEGTPS